MLLPWICFLKQTSKFNNGGHKKQDISVLLFIHRRIMKTKDPETCYRNFFYCNSSIESKKKKKRNTNTKQCSNDLPSLTFSHQRKKEMSINCRKNKIKSKHQYVHMDTTIKSFFLLIFPLRLHLKNWPPHLNFAVCQAQTKTIANRTQVYQNILRCDKNWQEDTQTSYLFDSEMMPNKIIAFQKTFQKKKMIIWAIKNKGKKNILMLYHCTSVLYAITWIKFNSMKIMAKSSQLNHIHYQKADIKHVCGVQQFGWFKAFMYDRICKL